MSIEALAMAGVDYMKCDIDVEKWERCGEKQPPSHLLAEGNVPSNEIFMEKDKLIRARIQEWAKAVASMKTTTHFDQMGEIHLAG